jgi:hypothetical protein
MKPTTVSIWRPGRSRVAADAVDDAVSHLRSVFPRDALSMRQIADVELFTGRMRTSPGAPSQEMNCIAAAPPAEVGPPRRGGGSRGGHARRISARPRGKCETDERDPTEYEQPDHEVGRELEEHGERAIALAKV